MLINQIHYFSIKCSAPPSDFLCNQTKVFQYLSFYFIFLISAHEAHFQKRIADSGSGHDCNAMIIILNPSYNRLWKYDKAFCFVELMSECGSFQALAISEAFQTSNIPGTQRFLSRVIEFHGWPESCKDNIRV